MKVILFDFDGTIAESIDILLQILTKLSLKRRFAALNERELIELRRHSVKELFAKLKVPDDQLVEFISEIFQELNKQIPQVKVFVGLSPILIQLKREGFKLGIVTTNKLDNIQTFLKNNNLELFTYLETDIPVFDKDKVLQEFLTKYQLKSDDVVYIGDEIRDIEAAHKTGIRIVSVTWGYNTKESLARYSPDYLFEKPSELLKLVTTKD